MTFLFKQFRPKRMYIQPARRQCDIQRFIIGLHTYGRQGVIATATGKDNRQAQQATQALCQTRRYGILLGQ